jgi:predicted component of type VI protein secretion system
MQKQIQARVPLRHRLIHGLSDGFRREDYIQDIKNNVEAMLNTPVHTEGLSDLLKQSLLGYGMPEKHRRAAAQSYHDDTILKALADWIQQQEPRLTTCHVLLAQPNASLGYRVQLIIEAVIHYQNKESVLAFQTACNPLTMRFSVS